MQLLRPGTAAVTAAVTAAEQRANSRSARCSAAEQRATIVVHVHSEKERGRGTGVSRPSPSLPPSAGTLNQAAAPADEGRSLPRIIGWAFPFLAGLPRAHLVFRCA